MSGVDLVAPISCTLEFTTTTLYLMRKQVPLHMMNLDSNEMRNTLTESHNIIFVKDDAQYMTKQDTPEFKMLACASSNYSIPVNLMLLAILLVAVFHNTNIPLLMQY